MKKWRINRPDDNAVKDFSQRCDLNKLSLEVLSSRGFNDFDKIVEFFNDDELSDPFEIKDMALAAEIINKTIDSYDLICVYGDYDCDGVTATVILYNYLESMGANVMYYIPEREDGYGLNINAVNDFHDKGVKLIITVDNGISAFDEADKINELGMELIVTDHHQPSENLPTARAIVDPHRIDCPSSFKALSGVGVALKLCAALDGGSYDAVMEQYADLCAIGTVADIVSLNGENRTIAINGMRYLANTENLGLRFLLEKMSVDVNNITSTDIGFRIGPVINASGRFGSPMTAVKALLAEDDTDAQDTVDMMITLNNMRKETEKTIMKDIVEYIDANPDVLNHRVIVLSGKGWHHGVIGIVSSRIMDYYGKPNVIISVDSDGKARGSARSLHGFNIFKCFQSCADLLEKFGGHECAGGFSLDEDKISEFTKRIYEYSDGMDSFPISELTADVLLSPEVISIEEIRGLSRLEPFGEGNQLPMFAVLGARVDGIIPLSQGKHTKIEFTYGSYHGQALIFSVSPQNTNLTVNQRIDMIVKLSVNKFHDKESVSIIVADYRQSGTKQDKYFAAKECYEKLMRGDKLPSAFVKKIIPTRDELVKVYREVSKLKSTNVDKLFMSLNDNSINYCKLRICLDIFKDKSLINYKPSCYAIELLPVSHKVVLDDSETLVKLNGML